MRKIPQMVTNISFGKTSYSWIKGVAAPVSSLKDYVSKAMPAANANTNTTLKG